MKLHAPHGKNLPQLIHTSVTLGDVLQLFGFDVEV